MDYKNVGVVTKAFMVSKSSKAILAEFEVDGLKYKDWLPISHIK